MSKIICTPKCINRRMGYRLVIWNGKNKKNHLICDKSIKKLHIYFKETKQKKQDWKSYHPKKPCFKIFGPTGVFKSFLLGKSLSDDPFSVTHAQLRGYGWPVKVLYSVMTKMKDVDRLQMTSRIKCTVVRLAPWSD